MGRGKGGQGRAIAVAGGDGELGFHIIGRLREEGYTDIRCIGLRPFRDAAACSSFICDIAAPPGSCDRQTLCDALKGCSGVICALMPPLMTAPKEAFFLSNVDAVGVLIEESERHGVKSFVHISSIAVMNHFVDHVNVDESAPLPKPSEYRSPYDATKRLGEEKVLAVSSDMWTLSLRCGGIISSHKAMQFMGLYEKTGILLWAGKPIDTTHGVNVAWAAHLGLSALASRQDDVNREVFYVTGEPLNQRDVAIHMTSRLGNTYTILPFILVQAILGGMWLAHGIKRLFARVFRSSSVPAIGLHQFVQMGKFSQTFSNEKARRVLNYTPILSTDEAFDRIVAEYKASLANNPVPGQGTGPDEPVAYGARHT